MKTKLKLSTILPLVIFALTLIFPISVNTATAMTFELRIPSFSLYCDNQNADIHGKVKYVINEDGKAIQYSEYTINNTTDDLTLYIPFIADFFTIPKIDIAEEYELCYGETTSFHDEYNYDFYSPNIDGMMGTLYTLKVINNNLTIEFKTLENQNYIYLLPQEFDRINGDKHFTYTANDLQPDLECQIFIINGDYSEFKSNAEINKETISVKDFIARNLTEFEDYFANLGNASPDLLYALINQALVNDINYDLFDFFLSSYTQKCLMAYKFTVRPNSTITYSMPVDVQKNTAFNLVIYLTEQRTTGNYNIDYSIEMNSNLPFIIESSAEVKKQTDNLYTAGNVNSDFYFVFSSAEKPQSIYGDNNKFEAWQIILFVILGVALCAFIVSTTILIISVVKNRKQRKGNK